MLDKIKRSIVDSKILNVYSANIDIYPIYDIENSKEIVSRKIVHISIKLKNFDVIKEFEINTILLNCGLGLDQYEILPRKGEISLYISILYTKEEID